MSMKADFGVAWSSILLLVARLTMPEARGQVGIMVVT
jgi:hypothetical protein